MIGRLFTRVTRGIGIHLDALNQRFIRWTTLSTGRLAVAASADLTRSKPALVAENAFLRRQLIVLNRHVARPRPTRKRQDSERNRAAMRVSLRRHLPDVAYAACSTAHTSPHRSWNKRR